MNSKDRFDFYAKELDFKQSPEDAVRDLVNDLIAALYIPVEGFEGITKVDPKRLKHFRIEDEGINWGDLRCNEVKKFEDGSFLVVVDEAAPNDCPTFCDYIERYMRSYGWECRVETEW